MIVVCGLPFPSLEGYLSVDVFLLWSLGLPLRSPSQEPMDEGTWNVNGFAVVCRLVSPTILRRGRGCNATAFASNANPFASKFG